MSDPTIEEDSLISQDDIDKLLESNSIEDAEDQFASNDDGADELGELSQDDIDSLMNSNLPVQDDSLDVLDKLDEPDTAVIEDGEMELISQDDIDQLMNSNAASGDESLPVLDDEEEFEELSKDDIKALMGAKDSEPDRKTGGDSEDRAETGMNSEDNILVDEKIAPAPVKQSRIKQDDFIINESEAMGVADCLITQKTIDGLIKNLNADPVSDPVVLDEEPQAVQELKIFPEPSAAASPLDDAEDFLKPKTDADVLDLNDEREDVTQEDIDALLTESDDEEEAEDDILISQDDIDTLLMAADQEDEDVLGELIEKGLEGDLDGSLDDGMPEKEISDETDAEEEDEEETDEEENEDQVVLQGDDEVAVKPKKKKRKAGAPWYKKKLVLASLSVLVILGITVPITYFFFFSGEQMKPQIVSEPQKPEENTHKEVKIETVAVPVEQPVESKNPGNMVLKDFIILAPDLLKNMTYITVEISIDYADRKAFQEIQNNLSYFRDLIYDSIRKGLVAEKQEKITEAEILSMVEKVLKKALPADSVSRVGFLSFKIT